MKVTNNITVKQTYGKQLKFLPLFKRSQQGGGSMMTWAGIVNQTIIVPFKVYERVKSIILKIESA